MALETRLKRICRTRLLVDMERADVLRDGDLQLDLLLAQPVAQAVDRRARHRRDVGLADVERHDAGVDGGEVEDIVDERAAARATTQSMWPMYSRCCGLSAPSRLVRQQLGKADDVGERRAQLVGDVLDEVGLQPVGGLQRLVPLLQHALDAGRVGHVHEGEHGHAFGKRDGRVVDDAAVGAAMRPTAWSSWSRSVTAVRIASQAALSE